MTQRLQGLRVLITRTAKQAKPLLTLIEAEGGMGTPAGVLSIEADYGDPSVAAAKAALDQYHRFIFVSANAVEHGLAALGSLPDEARLACVGRKTRQTLEQAGYSVADCPESDFNSEALLALPSLQNVDGERILIVRGHGGRQLIRDTLQQRGAQVDSVECYHRQLSDGDFRPLQDAIESGAFDVICPSSSESLALLSQACPSKSLKSLPLIAVSATMQDKARELGFTQIAAMAKDATDESIFDALLEFQQGRRSPTTDAPTAKNTASKKTMSDNTPPQNSDNSAPAQKPQKREKAAGVGLAKTLAFLAIVLVVVASLFGYEQLRQLQETVDAQGAELDNLDANDSFSTFKQRLSERFDALNDSDHQQQQSLETLQELVSKTAAAAHRNQRDWVLAEVRYLMNMASARLNLLRDVDSAVAALKSADQRLASLRDPAFFATREALAEEISELQSVGAIDSNGIALKLMSVSKMVNRLPPATIVVSDDPADAAQAEAEGKAWWSDIVRWLGIRQTNRPYFVPSKQEEAFYADQLLRLEIEAARHAVLRFDRKDYQQRIDSALSVIDNYYDPDSQLVKMIGKELRAMVGAVVFPQLPDISRSSIELNQATSRYALAEESEAP